MRTVTLDCSASWGKSILATTKKEEAEWEDTDDGDATHNEEVLKEGFHLGDVD